MSMPLLRFPAPQTIESVVEIVLFKSSTIPQVSNSVLPLHVVNGIHGDSLEWHLIRAVIPAKAGILILPKNSCYKIPIRRTAAFAGMTIFC